jgi:dTDP-4-amino-4,6-dideoxygalactose transaminase
LIPITAIPINLQDISNLAFENRRAFYNLQENLARNHQAAKVILLNSGRSALALAIKCIRRRSNRIALPYYTCPILYEVIMSEGFLPVPIDVDYDTLQLDLQQLEKEVQAGLDAVLVVHIFGDPVPVKEVRKIAPESTIIEDCAQCIGAEVDSSLVGTQGDFSIFSFGIGKVITGGIGGALAVSSKMLEFVMDSNWSVSHKNSLQALKALFWLSGMKLGSSYSFYSFQRKILWRKYMLEDHLEVGRILHNEPRKLNPTLLSSRICNTVLLQLTKLDSIIRSRRANSKLLKDLLWRLIANGVISSQAERGISVFTRFVLRLPGTRQHETVVHLLKNGIEAERPYASLNRLFNRFNGNYPTSSRLLRESISIPIHYQLNESQLHRISEIVLAVNLKS